MTTLESDRLLLRTFRMSDARTVQKLAGDRAVAEMTRNIPHPYPDGAAQAWIAALKEAVRSGKELTLAITLQENQQLIGCISLIINENDQHAEIGYWIGKPYWGCGYCTEAARVIIDYGFRQLELQRVFGCYLTKNPASGKVMEKVGMQYEGCQRGHILKWGVFEDIGLYGMMRSEWEEHS